MSARLVPGEGRLENIDLVQRKVQDMMCQVCEAMTRNRPEQDPYMPVKLVFHGQTTCPHIVKDEDELQNPLPVPDIDVIQGYRDSECRRGTNRDIPLVVVGVVCFCAPWLLCHIHTTSSDRETERVV